MHMNNDICNVHEWMENFAPARKVGVTTPRVFLVYEMGASCGTPRAGVS
jgi:hypothetical protein